MASSSVSNPTNAPSRPNQALPFTTKGQVTALATKSKDAFNSGKDYKDEGAPLLTSDSVVTKAAPRLGYALLPGLTDPMSREELDVLSHPDENAQTPIKYLREAVVMDIDAKLIISTEAQMKRAVANNDLSLFRESHYPTLPEYFKSSYYRKLRESRIIVERLAKTATTGSGKRLREAGVVGLHYNPKLVRAYNQADLSIVKKLKESRRFREDFFSSDGGDIAGVGSLQPSWDGGNTFAVGGRQPDFTPLISGPYNKQLYWFDYLDMHSKAYEAWTHNPIAKRICKVITQFVLGKGVKATVMSAAVATKNVQQDPKTGQQVPVMQDYRKKCQELLDMHWMKNSLHIRSKQILRDLIIFGEQFPRYYDAPWGLKIRQIDPSTVWEVITDPDDCENEFYIHQQYPTRYQWYVDLPVPTIKFIIRQVPSLLYFHMKINSVAGEVRGRSELFAILGWLKRIKEFASDRVIRNKMGNLFVLDVAVEGDASAVEQAKQQFSGPPTPGSFFIHNKAAELKAVSSEIGASEMQGDWELLLTVIAMGAGMSQEYLGMGGKGGKAQALVGTEPDIKTFEDYQEIMEQFFLQDAQRVFMRHKERGEIPRNMGITVEITYPALAEENRSEKLKDLAFGESMSWWSHRRVASAAAKELQFTSYEYDSEQQQIAEEDAQKLYLINTAYQQVTKGTDSLAAAAAGKAGGSGGSGGTSSGSSGKGASGMGMGKMGAGGGKSGEAGLESVRESEDDAEDDAAVPATAPGTSTATNVHGRATTHNASVADGKRDPYDDMDPRDFAESLKREAANLRYERRGIGRRQDRTQSPYKVRDQKSLDRGAAIGDARKALKSGNFNHESGGIRGKDGHIRFPREADEGGPGSGPHGNHSDLKPKSYAELQDMLDNAHSKVLSAKGDLRLAVRMRNSGLINKRDTEVKHAIERRQAIKDEMNSRRSKESDRTPSQDANRGAIELPRQEVRLQKQRGSKRESMEPFKQQDGEKLQRPRHEDFPTEKQAHRVTTGRRNSPRGYGANKREYPN